MSSFVTFRLTFKVLTCTTVHQHLTQLRLGSLLISNSLRSLTPKDLANHLHNQHSVALSQLCTKSAGPISLKAWESNLVALARNSLITSSYDTHPRPSSLTKPPPRTSHFVVSTPSGVEERLLPPAANPNPTYCSFLNCLILKWQHVRWHDRDTGHTTQWAWCRSAQAPANFLSKIYFLDINSHSSQNTSFDFSICRVFIYLWFI
jgi:hypothetical protein